LSESGDATRVLPIMIGPAEAQAIVLGASGVAPPRPLTHDLLLDVLRALGAELLAVEVTELRDGTFFAELVVETAAGIERVSSRPSDGIALAVRVDTPLSVAAEVLESAAVEVEHEVQEGFTDEEIESIVGDFQEFLATASPADFASAEAPGEPASPPDTDEEPAEEAGDDAADGSDSGDAEDDEPDN
jgi:bifunctional DNase/RNase